MHFTGFITEMSSTTAPYPYKDEGKTVRQETEGFSQGKVAACIVVPAIVLSK